MEFSSFIFLKFIYLFIYFIIIIFFFFFNVWLILTKLSKFLSYCLFDCKDINSFSNKPPFQNQTYLQSSIKMPGKEENLSTLTKRNQQSLQHFSFKLRVHFNQWIGSDSMATALTSNRSYSMSTTETKSWEKKF